MKLRRLSCKEYSALLDKVMLPIRIKDIEKWDYTTKVTKACDSFGSYVHIVSNKRWRLFYISDTNPNTKTKEDLVKEAIGRITYDTI